MSFFRNLSISIVVAIISVFILWKLTSHVSSNIRRAERLEREREFAVVWGKAHDAYIAGDMRLAATKFNEALKVIEQEPVAQKRERFFQFLGHAYLAKIYAFHTNQAQSKAHANVALRLGGEFMEGLGTAEDLERAIDRHQKSVGGMNSSKAIPSEPGSANHQ